MDFVGHWVTPLHPEFVIIDIAIKYYILFCCSCLVVRDILIGEVWGVIHVIGITMVAVFVLLVSGTAASAGPGAGCTVDTTAWWTVEDVIMMRLLVVLEV